MASSGTLLFIFTVVCISAVKSGFLKLECKTKNVGYYGQHSLLECVIKTSTDVTDPTICVVAWKKLTSSEDEGDLLLGFNRGRLDRPKQGYRFAEPLWDERNMNVSLLITNTAVADDGDYECIVITDSGDDRMVTTLKVQARYSNLTVHSIHEKIVPNTNITLICESRGGYQKGTLQWFDEEGNDWTKSSEMEVTQSDDGLFQLTSRLHLFRGITFQRYTCVVLNASGGKEDEFIFEVPAPPGLPPPSGPESIEICKILVRLMVTGSLMVGLLCVLLFYRWRAQQVQKCSTEPHMVGHHAVYRPEVDL